MTRHQLHTDHTESVFNAVQRQMTGIYDSVSELPWCFTHSEDFHLQAAEHNIGHHKSLHIHASDGFVQTLVFLITSQFSQS